MQRMVIRAAGVGLILILGIAAIIFFNARSSLAEDLNNAETLLHAEADIESVNNVSYYFGEDAVYTAEITNTEGENEWVFIRNEEIEERLPEQQSLKRSEAEELVKETFDLQKVRSVKPGYEQGEPIYEITCEKDNRLHFYYMNLKNGEFIKRYSMKQS
ncbi:PepSY domain-containing protein [Alteribacillus sp. JSM 102045]|uniref:PepSY domain-containing protein n=1 Tax=Alteribacillus sp. JSM 102045 TaxID=1562101 RepID=UPI0035C15E4B